MTIVITGGSGFIGTELSKTLLSKGHIVIVIDKQGPIYTHKNLFFIPCDLEKSTLPFNVLERTDAIIHLAGANLFSRWTDSVKENIRNSRVLSTRHLVESLKQTTSKPPIFISASAVGYYGEGDEEFDEKSAKGEGFLSDLVQDWETEAMSAEDLGCRVAFIRTAPVIGKGGFLKPLWLASRVHIVPKVKRENFWMPWIHIQDLVRVYLFALETNTVQGVVNAVAPNTIQYNDFIKTFAKKTKSLVVRMSGIFKLLFKDLAKESMISQKVTPKVLLSKGFEFTHTDLAEALKSLRNESR